MTHVIRFPGVPKSKLVYCAPFKFSFPQLYRISGKDGTRYSLSYDLIGPPSASEAEAMESLHPDDPFSLIVRWHPRPDLAEAYRSGIMDLGTSMRGIYQIGDGCFTVARRQTKELWPSPMLFYVAEVPPFVSNLSPFYWELGISCDGKRHETALLRPT
jgi:hypothetical protein